MTFLSWLIVLLVVTLASIVVLLIILNHKERKMWMKAFGTQYGISPASMEAPIKKEPIVVRPDTRPRISIPIPGNDLFRKSAHQK